MTVKELIEKLNEIEDKDAKVIVSIIPLDPKGLFETTSNNGSKYVVITGNH